MRRQASLREGARAAEELASYLLGFSIRKAIDPLSPSGFILICEQVSQKLIAAAQGAEADVVAQAIGQLDLDWAKLSPSATAAAMRAVDKAIATAFEKKVLPKVASVLKQEGPLVMKSTRLAVIAHEKIKIAPQPTDEETHAHELIRDLHINYIRMAAGDRINGLSQLARDYVAEQVAGGQNSATIADGLKEQFGEDIPRPVSYWRVVADAFVSHGRVAEQIYAYQDAGIETYEFVAVMDEVTSDICRFLDGHIFSVDKASDVLERLIELDNPEDVKYVSPWVRKGKDEDGGARLYIPRADGSTITVAKVDRSGVGDLDDHGEYSGAMSDEALEALGIPVPPLHGRCRSTIVASV